MKFEEWDNPDVIYVLLGNSNLKQRQWKKAKDCYRQALDTNPDYARAFVGLGSVFLAQATENAGIDTHDYDSELLEQAATNYTMALNSDDQPPLADISAKTNFGLAQISLRRALIEKKRENIKDRNAYYFLAIKSFQAVIRNHNTGDKSTQERIQELAADAHACIGLIYWSQGQPEKAISEYQKAIKLLLDYGKEEREAYQKALDELQALKMKR